MPFYNGAYMGLDFRVQLLVNNSADDSPTVIELPWLGNSLIRTTMAPLMPRDDEGFVTSVGDMPIDVNTPAHTSLVEMHRGIQREREELGNELERDMRGDTDEPVSRWDELYPRYKGLCEFSDLIAVSLAGIKRASKNPAIHARIIWC